MAVMQKNTIVNRTNDAQMIIGYFTNFSSLYDNRSNNEAMESGSKETTIISMIRLVYANRTSSRIDHRNVENAAIEKVKA
jgi:hypothetical protein